MSYVEGSSGSNSSGGGVSSLFGSNPGLLAGGALVGLLNGVGVMFLRIPPIIMTLGMSSMVEGGLLGRKSGQGFYAYDH